MKQSGQYKRRTKIVGTIGTASGPATIIDRMIRGGMNVARFNLSHGDYAVHARYIQTVRRISQHLGIPVAILIDLPGPKYRIGNLAGGQVVLQKGATLTLTSLDVAGDASLVRVNFPGLPQHVKSGDIILLDDGAIRLRVTGIAGEKIECRVIVGGILVEHRGLVVPGLRLSGPFLAGYLREHLLHAIREKPDYLAVSFVSSGEDVSSVRAFLQENSVDIPIIAKIERVQAVRDFDSILSVSDGIMVARGDLGVDIPLERVPLVQKEVIYKCNHAGKPVITATQMLESMVSAAQPTRAEVTDVANAIFDGTDAIMLSAESAIGKYPVAAVKMMDKIARVTERRLSYEHLLAERGSWLEHKADELISYSACHTAQTLGAAAIVAFTQSGSTARRVSKYRPRVPILAITPDATVSGRLLLHWGVYPFRVGEATTVDELFTTAARLAKDVRIARPDDLIVITGGVPVGIAGSTNLLKVEKIT